MVRVDRSDRKGLEIAIAPPWHRRVVVAFGDVSDPTRWQISKDNSAFYNVRRVIQGGN